MMTDDLLYRLRNVMCSDDPVLEEAVKYIESMKAEVLAWQKLGNEATDGISKAVDDLMRATKFANEKHKQVEQLRELCNSQNKTMAKMSLQINELAELAGVVVKQTKQ